MIKIILIAVLTIATASALSEEYICDKAFFVVISGGNIDTLTEKVGNVSEGYIEDYSNKCSEFRRLPEIKEINSTTNKTICDYDLDEEILWGVYNMNQSVSLDFFSFILENKTCEDIQDYRWIFQVEQTEDSFILTGLRLWWIIMLVFLIPIWVLVRTSTKLNKQIEMELKHV